MLVCIMAENSQNNFVYYSRTMIIATVVVAVLGYIDYLTGEISIDLLYLLCVGLVTWYTNIFIGVVSILEILVVKAVADFYVNIEVDSRLYEWNLFSHIFMFTIVCVLISKLRKVLER